MRAFTGLQAKMTASYVLVTAAAVVLVEVVALGLLVPNAVSASDVKTRVQATAAAMASKLSATWDSASSAGVHALPLGSPVETAPGTVVADDAGGVVVPDVTGPASDGPTSTAVALLVSRDGTVLASSYPALYPVGSTPQLPYDPSTTVKGGGSGKSAHGPVVYAVGPVAPSAVHDGGPKSSPSAVPSASSKLGPSTEPSPIAVPVVPATVYVEVPQGAAVGGSRDMGPSLRLAALVLLFLLPVGAAFGYLTTRRLVRRVRTLEDMTSHLAAGELDRRATVTGRDEISGLERGFNSMAEQLRESLDAER
jgi:HAMP domain-containing protein